MKKNRFITGFSGLRAIAVIAVILYHVDPNTFVGGYLGVPIFLVLSGYLVTDHILKSYHERGFYDWKNFYRKRVKKLYPQLISVLWISSAWIILFQKNLLAKLAQIVVANLLNVYNFWQILNGQSYFERFASNESPFTHLWTMSLEGQFYIFWPLIIYLLVRFARTRKRVFWIIFAVSVLSAIEMAVLYLSKADINRIYYGTDTRFFALGLGAAMAVIWPVEDLREEVANTDRKILDIAGLVAFLGMFILFFNSSMNPQMPFAYLGGIFIFSLLTTIMVAIIAHPASNWNRFLTNPIFNWIGSRSYGIYLYQFPVMIFFEDKFTNIGDHPGLYHILEIILILLLAEITYRLIEHPFGKITLLDLKQKVKDFKQISDKTIEKQVKMISFILIFLLGSYGIIISPTVKSQNFNKSQLAQRISANNKQQAKDNEKLIKSLKKRPKSESAKKAYEIAGHQAKKHPVNKNYQKYGISQLDLQLAQNLRVLAIGDSVMAGSSNALKKLLPHAIIDAAVSRQLNVAFGLLSNYQEQGVLADNVLIGLGTNGPFSPQDVEHLMKEVGPKRRVFWINTHVPTRQWQGQVNDLLANVQKRYHNLKVIDWYNYSKNHPNWFYDDQTHPNNLGEKYYSAFIVKSIIAHAKF